MQAPTPKNGVVHAIPEFIYMSVSYINTPTGLAMHLPIDLMNGRLPTPDRNRR
jgi:hypothetical protein